MRVPSGCVGKTLGEMKIRNRFHLQVLAIKTTDEAVDGRRPSETIVIPDATFRLEAHHVLIIMGENNNIEAFRKLP